MLFHLREKYSVLFKKNWIEIILFINIINIYVYNIILLYIIYYYI